jgi:hypothetical protein
MSHRPNGPAQKLSAQEFARLVTQGVMHVSDRYGHAIGKDSLVELRASLMGQADPFWQVTDVKPVMDPRLPAGHIKLELKSTTYLVLPVGVRTQALFLIGSVQRDETGKELPPAAVLQDDVPAPPPPEQPTGIELTDGEEKGHDHGQES